MTCHPNRIAFLLCIFLIGFAMPKKALATHIVGGELYYDCLGNNQYRITLKVYRDCGPNSQAPYDDPANVSVFGANNQLLQNLSINFPGSTNVPFVASNPCFQAPPNVCVEQAIYQTVITLPVAANGLLTLAYQRCCRNNSILNIVAPQNTGSTYTETIPASNQIVCNSSPRFTNFPPIALCVGDSLVFDHSATDPDGDSLVYQLCSTYQGADPNNPQPVPTSNPPFDPILFQAPYTENAPIASLPAISINPQTGLLKVHPNLQGQYVVGVCAQEYRNGVLIGTHRRDFQFNVTVCLTNVHSAFNLPNDLPVNPQGEIVSCGDYEMQFDNQSINGQIWHWDFGVPNINTDVSTVAEPTYTYNDTGTYTIMLVANPGFFCADTAFRTLVIKPLIGVDFNDNLPQCLANHSFNFMGTGTYSDAAQFAWNFGAQATPATANTLNVNNVTYNTWGDYPVSFTITDNECTETATDTVRVYGPLTGAWEIDSGEDCIPFTIQFNNTSQTTNLPVSYQWSFGDGSPNSALPSPIHTYNQAGDFDVSLTITDLSGCNANVFVLKPDAVTVNPIPQAGFDYEPKEVSILLAQIRYMDESQDATSCLYYFGDGATSTNCSGMYEYMEAGRYPIMQVVTNEFGCTDTLIQYVTILPEYALYIPNTFTCDENGINELWEVKGIGIKEYHLLIFNRWGERIFETETFKHYWNGRRYNRGDVVQQDVYAYRIMVRDVFGRQHEYFGHVMLLK